MRPEPCPAGPRSEGLLATGIRERSAAVSLVMQMASNLRGRGGGGVRSWRGLSWRMVVAMRMVVSVPVAVAVPRSRSRLAGTGALGPPANARRASVRSSINGGGTGAFGCPVRIAWPRARSRAERSRCGRRLNFRARDGMRTAFGASACCVSQLDGGHVNRDVMRCWIGLGRDGGAVRLREQYRPRVVGEMACAPRSRQGNARARVRKLPSSIDTRRLQTYDESARARAVTCRRRDASRATRRTPRAGVQPAAAGRGRSAARR